MRKYLFTLIVIICCILKAGAQNFIYISGPFADEKPPVTLYADFYESHKLFETSPGSEIYTGDFTFEDGGWWCFRFYTQLVEGKDWSDAMPHRYTICPDGQEIPVLLNEYGIAEYPTYYWETPDSSNLYREPGVWLLPEMTQYPKTDRVFYHFVVDRNKNTVTIDNGSTVFLLGGTTKGSFPTYETIGNFKDVALTAETPVRQIAIGDNLFSLFFYSLAHNTITMANGESEIMWDENVFQISNSVTVPYENGTLVRPWKVSDWHGGKVIVSRNGFVNFDNVHNLYLTWPDRDNVLFERMSESETGNKIYSVTLHNPQIFNQIPEFYFSFSNNNQQYDFNRLNGKGRIIFDGNGNAVDNIFQGPIPSNFNLPNLKGDYITLTVDLNKMECRIFASPENETSYKIFVTPNTPASAPVISNLIQFKEWMIFPRTDDPNIYTGSFSVPEKFECYLIDKLGENISETIFISPEDDTELSTSSTSTKYIETNFSNLKKWNVLEIDGSDFIVNLNTANQTVEFPSLLGSLFIVGSLNDWLTPSEYNRHLFEDYMLHAVKPNIYEGIFDIPNLGPYNQLRFRFYSKLVDWDSYSIGCVINDESLACELINGQYEGICVDGKGIWYFPYWEGNKLGVRINLNNYTVQIYDPDLTHMPSLPSQLYFVGDITNWLSPSEDNSSYYEAFKLKETLPGQFSGDYDIPAGRASFMFYKELKGFEGASIGVTKEKDFSECYFNNGSFKSTYFDNGKGYWNFPYWEGGKMYIKIDTSNQTVEYSDTPISGVDTIKESEVKVYGDYGSLTIFSSSEEVITIYNVSGIPVYNGKILVGQTTVNLPAGLYITQGKKVLVK